MFRWEPEGRYYHWLCTIAPFWFSTEHIWAAITPFWLSTDDMCCVRIIVTIDLVSVRLLAISIFFFFSLLQNLHWQLYLRNRLYRLLDRLTCPVIWKDQGFTSNQNFQHEQIWPHAQSVCRRYWGRTLVIIQHRVACWEGGYKDDVMLKIRKNIHIKSTEYPFLKVCNGMFLFLFFIDMASKSLEKIGQNRVLV